MSAWAGVDDVPREHAVDDGPRVQLDTIESFAAVEEPGAQALLGDAENALIPEGGDIMVYGAGGAGKTTLTLDCAMHLGAGRDWLDITAARPARVLLVENEGPRALFRAKLRRKLAAWDGPPIDGRVQVLSAPWGKLTLADEQWRAQLALMIDEHEIDVVIAGPLTRLGMDTAGTLQEVNEFMALIADVRSRCRRRVAVILVHHENKGGSVSGAWEGAGDTLLHVSAAGPGQTLVHVQKARWASSLHGKTLTLLWGDGESFALQGERNIGAEIRELLADGAWRTAREIAEAIKAGTNRVSEHLDGDPVEGIEMRTGAQAQELERSPRSRLYGVHS